VLERYSDLLHKVFAFQGIDVEDGLCRIAGNCVRLCCQGIAIDIAKFKGEIGERICGKRKQSSTYQDAHAKANTPSISKSYDSRFSALFMSL
jgi:hypothetical protein